MNTALIQLQHVSFSYGKNQIIEDLNLDINHNSIVSFMGPSGCGKSTVLRLISGLESPASGAIYFDGNPVVLPPKTLRYSFQDYDALPWLTVEQNIFLSNRLLGTESLRQESCKELLSQIGLSNHRKKYPAQLSGGMRKRLALGRCIAGTPKAILLDEPFSSLDVAARDTLHGLVLNLSNQMKCAFVIVTHDIDEAVFLSNKIFISAPLPFQVRKIINVPFNYPRDSQIRESREFESITGTIRSLLVS